MGRSFSPPPPLLSRIARKLSPAPPPVATQYNQGLAPLHQFLASTEALLSDHEEEEAESGEDDSSFQECNLLQESKGEDVSNAGP